jgi:UDP-N-acetylmuramate dehydrogenase
VYNLLQKICEALKGIKQQTSLDLSKRSYIGIGGEAELALYPKTMEEVKRIMSVLNTFQSDYCIVGNMTNVLPPDQPKDKIFVFMKELAGVQIDDRVFVLAGTNASVLLKLCRYAEKSGAEFLAGIPCTLGGALYMNAGVSGRYMSDVVQSVTVLRAGKIQTISLEECVYSYKQSVFMNNNDVILGAHLQLEDRSAFVISQLEKEYLERRAHLPKGRSMGCVFKNPSNGSAGYWIEKAGLKGLRQGDASVAEEHANFIINGGNACEGDVRLLIQKIKETVYAKFGVALEEEIIYLS